MSEENFTPYCGLPERCGWSKEFTGEEDGKRSIYLVDRREVGKSLISRFVFDEEAGKWVFSDQHEAVCLNDPRLKERVKMNIRGVLGRMTGNLDVLGEF